MHRRLVDARGLRGCLALIGVLALPTLAGCPTGDGDGVVVGRFYALGCDGAFSFGAEDAPAKYNMGADFFVGEPIIDETELNPRHRLDIRIQRGGNSIEDTDSLYIQVRDVAAVAQAFSDSQGAAVGPDLDVTASLLLYVTCPTFFGSLESAPSANVQACPTVSASDLEALCATTDFNAALDPDVEFPPFTDGDSCILFCRFGQAERGQPVPDGFRIQFGDVISGIFSLNLTDQRMLDSGAEICGDGIDNDGDGETDESDCQVPPGAGKLRGTFNFEVRRGQVAQEFP